jgi:hypothetical protein
MSRVGRALVHEYRFVHKVVRDPRVAVRRWRRVTSPRTSFIERNHDPAHTLMLAGSGRSGSTWLSEVLVERFSCRMIFEPLRRDRVDLAAHVPWGVYVDAGRSDPELRAVMESIMTGRIRSRWTDRHNVRRLPGRRLVKEIRATNLLPWLHVQFPESPVLYLLRHPVPVAWSASELGWDPFFSEFTKQTELMDGPLAPWRDVIARHATDDDLFHRHVLRWCMENVVPVSQLAPASVHVLFYEDLVEDPLGELQRLARYLGRFAGGIWAFDPTPGTAVDRPSAANYRKTPMMAADERLRSWVDAVSPTQVQKALDLVAEFGLDRLYGSSVRPLLPADEVLLGAVEQPQAESPGRSTGTESSNSR